VGGVVDGGFVSVFQLGAAADISVGIELCMYGQGSCVLYCSVFVAFEKYRQRVVGKTTLPQACG
jgi:hypothetical protein